MEPLSFTTHSKLLNSPLIGIAPAVGYVLVRHRNAWNGYASNQFQGDLALVTHLDFAKLDAEYWRQRGSRFSIVETSVLALLSDEGLLYCADFQHDDPFNAWSLEEGSERVQLGVPISQVVHALGQDGCWKIEPNSDSLLQAAALFERPKRIDVDTVFRRHHSSPPTSAAASPFAYGGKAGMTWHSVARPGSRVTATRAIAEQVLSSAGTDLVNVMERFDASQEVRSARALEEFEQMRLEDDSDSHR